MTTTDDHLQDEEDVETAPLTAMDVTSVAPQRRQRPHMLVIVLAFAVVALVVAPLSLIALEVEHSRRQPPTTTTTRRVRASQTTIECSGSSDPSSYHNKCITPLLQLGDFAGADTVLYADEIFQVDWSEIVTRADVLHLGALQRACTTHKDSVIAWRYGLEPDPIAALVNRSDDQQLLDTLRQCPSLDVFIPSSIRGQGYCEDAAAYTKYTRTRMLPRWVFDLALFDQTLNRTVTYHELCPRTPVLMLNHYWDGLRDHAAGVWPTTKPLFLMPNIEMFELDADLLWQADAVVCKTVVCADYVTKWFTQQGNPRLARVLFTRHTSSDVATSALVASGNETRDSDWGQRARTKHKDFKSLTFVHTAGSSTQKGTARVFDCWLARPDLPRVDVYMNENLYDRLFRTAYDDKLHSHTATNIQLHLGDEGLSSMEFGAMIADASVFLCPSRMEGYGHYINQARASGGLVLTPDVPPMNELVTPTSGVLINARRDSWARHFLGGSSNHELGLRNVTGFVSRFRGVDLCAAVDTVLVQMDEPQRAARGERARQQYLYDTAFFAYKMRELREALRPQEAHDAW